VINTGTRRPRAIAAVRPNAGLERRFALALERLLERLHRSLAWWLLAQYRATPPAMAMDQTPAEEMERRMRELANRWEDRFDESAKRLAEYFGTRMRDRSDRQLRDILKRGGWSVEFKATPAMRDVLDATILQNVKLIKTIGQEHVNDVHRLVLASVQKGGDLATLRKELVDRYALSKKRANLIARHQNSLATSQFTRARQTELGIKKAIWMHSHAGAVPRRTHLDNDGKPFDVAKGWFDPDKRVRKRIWPGELINCRCVSKAVIPGLE
jgi:uncharacterized protein with gpF-like domain